MAKLQQLQWVEELLPLDILKKSMFGGNAYYRDQKLVLVLFEKSGNKNFHGKRFKFELWNGCMFPVEKSLHGEVLALFPFLISHPVLPKWLYLPQDTEDFDDRVEILVRKIFAPKSIFGVIPKEKKAKIKVSEKSKGKIQKRSIEEEIDTTQPRMFSDRDRDFDISALRSISDLKNLGPASEKEFLKAGIKSPAAFNKLGWKKTLEKLIAVNSKNNHAVFAYALIGALKNVEWFRISEEDKEAAREFTSLLRKKMVKSKTKVRAKN
ncbi:MAG: TfoX/Sxy family DNA transformation protein [Pseudobdellovibrionaceae bacterium]